jgi:predicted lipid-binding transport protein (Tim44 family)
MIALSWLFLLAAIATLLVGVFSDLVWVYISIGASVLAMILLLVGVVRRKPVQPATAGAPYGPPVGAAAARAPASRATTSPARTAAQRRPPTPAAPTAPARRPAAKKTAAKKAVARKPAAKKTTAKRTTAKTAAKKTTARKATSAASSSTRSMVVAIPERGTYHMSTCRFVKGRRDTERMQVATAKSQGFKACGVCKP